MVDGSDDTRQRVLQAAGAIFANKGFDATTVREICQRAGANQAAVNYYYRDKESLYLAAVEHAHCAGMDETAPSWAPGTPPEEKLRQFLEGMLSHLLDPNRPDWHTQLMMRELSFPTDACVRLVDAYIRPKADLLGSIVAELLPPSVPLEDRNLVCFSIVGQCLFYRCQRPIAELLVGSDEFARYDVARLTLHITRFSLAAIAGLAEQHSLAAAAESRP